MTGACRALLSGLFAAFLLAVPAHAQQIADNVGPLEVRLGDDPPWTAESRSGWLLFSNGTDPLSIKSYFSGRAPLTGGNRTISANVLVRGTGDKPSFAGLLFSGKGQSNYLGFLIRNDGAAVFMNRSPDGADFQPAQGVKARMDGSDVIELRETTGKIELVLNGEVALTAENPDGFAPTFGILAIGTGRFGFDAFAIDETNAQLASRTPDTNDDNTGPRTDNGPMTPEQTIRMQMLLGTTLGVLFHELGHALIGETKLPATGPEEDVADGFSAFVMSAVANETEDPSIADAMTGMVRYSALLWYYVSKAKKQAGYDHPWQDEHAPDIRRFRNVFCIIYGSNPARYEDMATRFELTIETRERCKHDFKKRYAAWESLLATVTRKMPGDETGMHPADAPGGRILLKIQVPQSPLAQELHHLINGPQAMLPQLTKFLEQAIVWPNDLKIEFRHCPGNPNAWYDPGNNAVTFCYEVTEFFMKFIMDGEKKDGPLSDASAPTVDPARFLPGRWSASLRNTDGKTFTLTVNFGADGSYWSAFTGGPQDVREEGTWKASIGTGGIITLDLNPTRMEPAQVCDANGNCQPNVARPSRNLLKVSGSDGFHMQGFDFKRAP